MWYFFKIYKLLGRYSDLRTNCWCCSVVGFSFQYGLIDTNCGLIYFNRCSRCKTILTFKNEVIFVSSIKRR